MNRITNNQTNNISLNYNDLIGAVHKQNKELFNQIWILALCNVSPEKKLLDLTDLINSSPKEAAFLTRIWESAFYRKADKMLRN